MDVEAFLSQFLVELEQAQRLIERNRSPPQLGSSRSPEDIIASHANRFLERQMCAFGFAAPKEAAVRTAVITGNSSCSKKHLNELEPVTICDMVVPSVHRGHHLVCRTVAEPITDVAVTSVVEDVNGDVVQLSLHNFRMDLDDVSWLPTGTILAIKEPYLKFAADEQSMEISVESPSDVVFINETDHEALDSLGALKWHRVEASAPEELHHLGMECFARQDLESAVRYYRRAIRLTPADPEVLIDYCDALLGLERFYEACEAAKQALNYGGDDEEYICRMARSAYGMREWFSAASNLRTVLSTNPACTQARKLLAKTLQRLAECEEGRYDLQHLYTRAHLDKRRYIDVADYTGPIEVVDITGKGKGMVASKHIPKGTLLVVAKAFACTHPDEHKGTLMAVNLITNQRDDKAQFFNKVRIVQTLLKNPHRAQELYSLYAGDLPRDEDMPFGVIDVARIENICAYNSFQMNYHDRDETSDDEGDSYLSETPTALYVMPSFINHACIGNAYRSFYGDVMVVHSICDMNKGDEVVFSYTDPLRPFDERAKQLLHYGIQCDCRLCELDKIDESRHEREELAEACDELTPMLDNDPRGLLEALGPMISEIRCSYVGRTELRLQLVKPLLLLAAAHSAMENFLDSTEALQECLDVVGDSSLQFFYGPAIHREMARCYTEAGQPANAEVCLDKAAKCMRIRTGMDDETIRGILDDSDSCLP